MISAAFPSCHMASLHPCAPSSWVGNLEITSGAKCILPAHKRNPLEPKRVNSVCVNKISNVGLKGSG